MLDLTNRIAQLSPEKLAVLSERLRERRGKVQLIPHIPNIGNKRMLSLAQEGLWFLNQMDPASPVYNIPVAIELHGTVDSVALQLSLDEISARHEILRTTVCPSGGRPFQVLSSHSAVQICYEDLGHNEALHPFEVWLREKVRQPLDLREGPLLKVYCGRFHDRCVLLIIMHHLISDAWSMKIFIGELVALYTAHVTGCVAKLCDLPIQYYDFAHWQRKFLSSDSYERQLKYWKQQLSGVLDLPPFPSDRSRQRDTGQALASLCVDISSSAATSFEALVKREGITQFIGFLAAFQIAIHLFTGLKDLVIGSPISGRFYLECENIIGLFADMQILRTNLGGNPKFRELLCRVHKVAVEAHDHHDVPFQKLVEAIQPPRNVNTIPLFQLTFTLQRDFNLPQLPGLTITKINVSTGIAMFDLDLKVIETKEKKVALFEYKHAIFDHATIARLSRAFLNVVEIVAEDSCLRLSEICERLQRAEAQYAAGQQLERQNILWARLAGSKRKTVVATP